MDIKDRDAHVRKLTEAQVAGYQADARTQEIKAKAEEERLQSENHVKELTADFVASKTVPIPAISETARNLLRVVMGKDNDPTIVNRALNELQRFRHEPAVAQFFAGYEKEEAARIFKARIEALKRGGFLRKMEGK